MKIITEAYKNNNDRLVLFFFLLATLNQAKFIFPSYNFIYYAYVLIFFSYVFFIFYKKKILINEINNYFLLIIIILLFLIENLVYKNAFDLKILIFLSLVVFLSFLVSEFNVEKIFLCFIYTSLFFLLVGAYGFLKGGEGGSWGDQYVYFGYHYFSSTRNEDAQIFLYGFLFSLFYIFYYKLNWKILIINQLNLLALILSFSRGIYLLLFLNFALIYIFIIFKQSNKLKHFLLYLFISIIFTYSSFQIINNTVKIDLNSVFVVKLVSLSEFVNKNETKFQEENKDFNKKTGLYKNSVKSLNFKLDDWLFFFENSNAIIFKNIIYKNENKNYVESSLLYSLKELSIIIFFLLCYFIILQVYKVFKIENIIEKKIFFLIILVNFIFLNSLYNYYDDIWNYLILFYIVLSSKKQSANF
tara:strand:+ start:7330 stop:8574 length:1245 start_codon:yes stop_codon:yes gene_type:complete